MNHPYFLPLRQRTLIWQFARREVLARYRGSLLGLGWSFLTPLLMLAVYTFVFRVVFKARWGTGSSDNFEFALQVYSGLIVFGLFAEVVNNAPRLVLNQPNLVKKVVFPLEILTWVTVLAGLFHLVLNLAVLLAAAGLARGGLPLTVVALPLVLAPFVPLLLGLAWFLAALGVYLRDIGQITTLVVNLLLFLSPIFYPLSMLPARWHPWLQANPLTPVIEELRRVTLEGQWPHWSQLALNLVVGLAVAWLGARWFAATRNGFADVI
ncbi:MAG: ABC transporter permease [Betaproteobacteria bacterium RIFCSPLOWO2_12_FULL_63_13]|nr:MAG: ABC transporter permease [Betaproteobacteria bacterium RIFCSPLOWO2_02_FULL_63_19]OGA44231.1 MAG: ABC transporter permease [Betaproteobacteria bacterium RIFCSPLOWO2_12_FULL_63_13]